MSSPQASGHVKDLSLAAEGVKRIQWAGREMPVVHLIQERFAKEKPLAGLRLAACLHVTTETANLAIALQAGGAEVVMCASNPLSTQDEVAAALVQEYGIPTFSIKGEDDQTYYDHINAVLDSKPQITLDDGADLVTILHRNRSDLLENVIGGTEETTTGVVRLTAMAKADRLRYPSLRSMKRKPSISSTTVTARARARWTASPGPPISFGPAEKWLCRDMVGAGGALPPELGAWARW